MQSNHQWDSYLSYANYHNRGQAWLTLREGYHSYCFMPDCATWEGNQPSEVTSKLQEVSSKLVFRCDTCVCHFFVLNFNAYSKRKLWMVKFLVSCSCAFQHDVWMGYNPPLLYIAYSILKLWMVKSLVHVHWSVLNRWKNQEPVTLVSVLFSRKFVLLFWMHQMNCW